MIYAYVNSSLRIYVLLGIPSTWELLHYTIVPRRPNAISKSVFLTNLWGILMPPLALTLYTLPLTKESKWQWMAVWQSLESAWVWERHGPWKGRVSCLVQELDIYDEAEVTDCGEVGKTQWAKLLTELKKKKRQELKVRHYHNQIHDMVTASGNSYPCQLFSQQKFSSI